MAAKEPIEIPGWHAEGLPAFRALAEGRKARLPIRSVVGAAAEAAREHGVFRSQGLCTWSTASSSGWWKPGGRASASDNGAGNSFLELVPPQTAGLAECLIELEGPRGKMRIQWKGATAPDLAGLSRVLWESA